MKGWIVVERLPDGTPVAWAPDASLDLTRIWNEPEQECLARARLWFERIRDRECAP